MRFHAILFVRDEEDVIGQSLTHNSQWCDNIYVYDTGSTDKTWDIVLNCAAKFPQIIPVLSTPVWWHDGLRAMVFNQFRRNSADGDWWVRLDADEFYHVNPRDFVSTLAPYETAIYHAYYNFVLTEQEASVLSTSTAILEERRRSLVDRRRHYVTAFEYAEPRFFRYRDSIQWSPGSFAPSNAGFVARKRIPIRHYPHRDPLQMARRFSLRKTMLTEMSRMSSTYATHWNVEDWRSELTLASHPNVRFWHSSQDPLPECTSTHHLAPPIKRASQWLAHQFLLPLLDRRRSKYPEHFAPTPIPKELQQQLAAVALSSSS